MRSLLILLLDERCGYFFRYLDPPPNGIHIGEPEENWLGWPRAILRGKPATHVFVDENNKTICLEDVEEGKYYRIKTLVTTYPGYVYMYMTDGGTSIYFHNIYLNPGHDRVKLRIVIS